MAGLAVNVLFRQTKLPECSLKILIHHPKATAESGLQQAMIYGHEGGMEAMRKHVKTIMQQGSFGQNESAENILPSINREYFDPRLVSLVTSISEAIIANDGPCYKF